MVEYVLHLPLDEMLSKLTKDELTDLAKMLMIENLHSKGLKKKEKEARKMAGNESPCSCCSRNNKT